MTHEIRLMQEHLTRLEQELATIEQCPMRTREPRDCFYYMQREDDEAQQQTKYENDADQARKGEQ